MRRPYVVGNWKMNTGPAEADALAIAAAEAVHRFGDHLDVGIAPPFVWIERVRARAGRHVRVAGQTCSAHASGAHTGEISAAMLVQAGADTVILGHSERRHVYGERDADVAGKMAAALGTGLSVILCVGETLDERESDATWEVVRTQLEGAVGSDTDPARITVAYEPVWAIGTGRTATPEQAQDVHALIRLWWSDRFGATAAAALRIQYGGSVKPENAAELMAMPDIDGALVGGASLAADGFTAIVAAAIPT